MAELSRLRGADTEEQLLELQRAFLASEDHRANAAARVTRVGGAPPKSQASDEAAGIVAEGATEIGLGAASVGSRGGTTSGNHDTSTDETRASMELRDVVTEVVERPRVGTAVPKHPTLVGDPGVSFPRATHRTAGPFAGRVSKFMADREARRAKAALGGEAGGHGDPDVAPPGTMRVGNANVSFQMMQPPSGAAKQTTIGRFDPTSPTDEQTGVTNEATRRLAEMSIADIEEAKASLKARLKPEALAFFQKRGARVRDGTGNAETGENSGENSGSGSKRGDGGNPFSGPGVGAGSFGVVSTALSATHNKHDVKTGSDSASGGSKNVNKTQGVSSPRGTEPIPSATTLTLTPPPPAPVETAAVRYTLAGSPLDVEDLRDAQRVASRLGSAVERDPLRAGLLGAKPQSPGYTIAEALDLARSSVPVQRVAGLNLLGKVLARAKRWGGTVSTNGNGAGPVSSSGPPAGLTNEKGRAGDASASAPGGLTSPVRRRRSVGIAGAYGGFGAPSDPLSLPPPLPTGVAWQDVWLHCTVDHDAVLMLRRCLDDDHLPAAAAAAGALSSLAGGADCGAGGVGAALRAAAGVHTLGSNTLSANVLNTTNNAGAASEQTVANANGATWWLDCAECAPPSRVSLAGCAAPVWRGGEPPEATFVPTTWQAATGQLSLREDGTVPPDPADEDDGVSESLGAGAAPGAGDGGSDDAAKLEKRRARAMTRAADPIASMLRTGILPRLRWMLEVGKFPRSVAPALALCAAAARHSAGGATAVARCPRLLDVLLWLAGGTETGTDISGGGAGTHHSYPPTGTAAAALRVIRLVAASGAEHGKRVGERGVLSRAVRAAVANGAPDTSRDAAGVWMETLRLWSATAAAGGLTPSVDGLYPLIAPMLELPTSTRGPDAASTAAAIAAEAFALLASVVDAGGLSKRRMENSENDETSAASHPSATLSMTETTSASMSWTCAAGAAGAAELWATTTNPGGRAAPVFATGAPGAERSNSAWRAAGAAAHFLASLLQAVTREGDAVASAAAIGAAQRTLGLEGDNSGNGTGIASGVGASESSAAGDASSPPTAVPVLEPEDGTYFPLTTFLRLIAHTRLTLFFFQSGLAAAALDGLGSGTNDGTDGAFAARAAYGIALHGALRLVAATPGAASSLRSLRLASRVVRQLTVSAAVCASAIAGAIEDGAIRAGRAPLVTAAELPGQLALVVALQLQEAADAEAFGASTESNENDEPDVDGAVAAVEAVAALVRALPPGAGCAARDALSAGLFSRRVLGPLLRVAAASVDDAAGKPEAFEAPGVAPGVARAVRRKFGGVNGATTWCVSAARELELSKAEVVGDTAGTTATNNDSPSKPSRSFPSPDKARASLLAGFTVELLSPFETSSVVSVVNSNATAACGTPPLVAVGSAIPLPPLPYWLLAPCSPKSTVDGWGPDGAAAALAMLLALESSGSLVTRDLPADAKLACVSGTFCLGRDVWTHPGVAAAAATLTDLYWDRLETEMSASVVNPRMGNSTYGYLGSAQPSAAGTDAKTVSAARLAEALCLSFAKESFGDRLFARHVALQLRAGAPARARAAAWNALGDGMAFHLLPPLAALAPRPERGDALLFLPPGGEQDPEMLELYLKALESGALDRCLVVMGTDETGESEILPPPLPAVLALHAATHAALGGGARATSTIRRVLSRIAEDGSLHPGVRAALIGMIHTPLTQRRRPAVARAAAAGVRGAAGAYETREPFGPGAAYGERAPEQDVHARRTGLLAACSENPELRAQLRKALDAVCDA
jgi:hypothetical protein